MKLDEAIAHAREVAEKNRNFDVIPEKVMATSTFKYNCLKCAEEHEQIAEWLEELKQYRAIGTVEECKNSVLKILEAYNKAIDDFVKEICKMIVQSENNDNYRFYAVEIKQAIADIAEQLKNGGGE